LLFRANRGDPRSAAGPTPRARDAFLPAYSPQPIGKTSNGAANATPMR